MANYATLKAAIQSVIKQNGNNEITGSLLQQSLLSMITSLGVGFQFMGVAYPTTNPGTPDQNVFYLASSAGTYSNFGGYVLVNGEIALLTYNGSWQKISTGAANAEQVSELSKELLGYTYNGNFNISSSGTHSSNNDRITFPTLIPPGQYTFLIQSGTTGNSGNVGVFIKYVGASSTTNIGTTRIGTPLTVTTTDFIESIGIYMTAAVNQSAGLMPLTIQSTDAGVKQTVDDIVNTIIPGINSDIEKNNSYILNNFIVGKGATFSGKFIYGLKKGSTYRIILQEPTLLTDTTTDTSVDKFSIRCQKSDDSYSYLVRVKIGAGTVANTYSFTIPNDFKENGHLWIGGRAVSGTVVNFFIEEVKTTEYMTYGIARCSTAAGTAQKDVTIPNLASVNTEKIRFVLIFSNPTTTSATLSINGQTARPLYYNGSRANSNNSWAANEKLDVVYNANYPAYFATTIPNLAQTVNSNSPDRNKIPSEAALVAYVGASTHESTKDYNIDKESAIVSAASRSPLLYEHNNKNLCAVFSILTDLHSDLTRFNRACKFADETSEILATLCLGDMINHSNANNPYPLILNYTKPVISITGNHEVMKKTSQGIAGWSESDIIGNIYNSDQVAHNGETHPSGKCYWYKDFSKTIDGTTKTLRVIGLHEFESNGTGEQNSGAGKDVCYYTQEQIDWLIARLDEVDANTYVMILIHFAPTANMTRVECPFTPSASFNFPLQGGSSTGGPNSMSDNEFIPKIVQAWIDGTTLNASCDITVGETVTHLTAIKNVAFAEHAGRFAGYFCGHTHRDFVGKLANYPKQLQFSFITTSAESMQNQCDIGRNTTGKTQDCFTIVSIDWFKNSINLIRIGADTTTDMRERKYYNILIPTE